MSKKNARKWLLENNHYQPTRAARTISITSGKGGVGKTSIAIKIGKILAEWDYRVLLFDCDYNLSNTAVKLGIPLSDNFNLLLKGKMTFEQCLFREKNFHVLSGCNGNLDLFDHHFKLDKFIIDLLSSCEKKYDFIILDCSAGISKEALSLNAYSDFRFFVIAPEKSSITDSYSLIKVLHNKYGINDNHLIVNKVSSFKQYQKMVKTLRDTVENFLHCRLHILGGIIRVNNDIDLFDQSLLLKRNTLHENFVKILNKFTEEISGKNLKEKYYIGANDFKENIQSKD